MSSRDRYAVSAGGDDWQVASTFPTNFRWEYQDGRESLLKLYAKGKQRQWDAETRIDWSCDLDPENPEQLPDERSRSALPAVERLRRARSNARRTPALGALAFMHGGRRLCVPARSSGGPTRRQVLRRTQ